MKKAKLVGKRNRLSLSAYLLLLSLAFLGGCVGNFDIFNFGSQPAGGGLKLSLDADPPQVFSQSAVRINVDLDNQNTRNIKDVVYEIFDTGRLSKAFPQPNSADFCAAIVPEMRKNEFRTYSCLLQAPAIQENGFTTDVHAYVKYKTDFPAVQVIDMMTEAEYIRQQSTGELNVKQQSYSYKDDNIQVDVDFSEPLPVVARPGKEYFVYFTISNIGDGFVRELKFGDFKVTPLRKDSPQVVDCSNAGINSQGWRIEPVGKEFPRIACRLVLPQGVRFLESYSLLVTVVYSYEIRSSVSIDVVK